MEANEPSCPACGGAIEAEERHCGACGAPRGPSPPAARGERRQLTVLFCDLVGSTEMSSRLDPEDYGELVSGFLDAASTVVARHGGHVAQHLGDGVLVYFGWPRAFDDAAERAVRAGLSLVDAARDAGLTVRVGLHTGRVVVSNVGVGPRAETLALGDTPNVAARIQSAATPGSVLLSATTQRLTAGAFVVEDRGEFGLKGVPVPMRLYRVVRSTGLRARTGTADGLLPVVGRASEVAMLLDAWERALERDTQAMLVIGEPGLGKSRLVQTLKERLTGTAHRWVESRCAPFTQDTAFHPLADGVGQALGLPATDSREARLAALARAGERLGSLAPDELTSLAEFLELPVPADGTTAPEQRRRRAMDVVLKVHQRLAEMVPLVLVVEDLQWCDPSSLELLGRLMDEGARSALLVIGTARPEFEAPWPARSHRQVLQIGRLTRRDARRIALQVIEAGAWLTDGAGPRELPPEVLETIVERAGGVPLFVEELAKLALESSHETTAAEIPMTLHDSLLARLDRLGSAKEVVQRAAVLGREFPYRLLAAIADTDDATLQAGLTRLVEAEILYRRSEPPDATYSFKHALIQEAAYESLLRRRRRELHGRVADALPLHFPAVAESEPEMLARHAEAAGQTDDAIAAYRRAGERARERSAYLEAARHVRRAIALLPDRGAPDDREAPLQLMLGSCLGARDPRDPAAQAAYDRARLVCEATGDVEHLNQALIGFASGSFNGGDMERGAEMAERVLGTARAGADDRWALQAHSHLAVFRHVQGEFLASQRHLESAEALFSAAADASQMAMGRVPVPLSLMVRQWKAWNSWYLGSSDRALVVAREVLAVARRLDHPLSEVLGLLCETAVHGWRGDAYRQRDLAAQIVALAERHALSYWIEVGRGWLVAAGATLGDPAALEEAAALSTAGLATGSLAAALRFVQVAEGQVAAGRLGDAQRTVEVCRAFAVATGQAFRSSDLDRLDADLVLARGDDVERAENLYRRALALARSQGARSLELRAATRLAALLVRLERSADARDTLAPVYAAFTEGFETADLRQAAAVLEQVRP